MERQTGQVHTRSKQPVKRPDGCLKNRLIAVDFDGTIVEHAYPEIGREVPDAIASLKFLQSEGADIILWTMRSDSALKEALHWCHERGIRFYGVNVNPDQSWTRSPKAYAHYYIDDAAVGCPLVHVGPRPYVDWQTVVEYIMEEFADG